ncbi:MAG: thiamine ABC transporter substrate binding subunit [Bdellovibrionia bacterium]
MIALLTGTLGATPNAGAEVSKPTLTLYVYDSFVAKGGLGSEIFPQFEKKCGCELKILPSGDGGQLLTRLQLDAERGKPSAQVAVGLDEPTFDRARPWLEGATDWIPRGMRDLHPDLKRTPGFYPFDYGFFAFMADHQALSEAKLSMPKKLTDLLAPQWKRQVILEDPRTSTPGLAFVLYANQVSGMSGKEFWPKMRTQWLTLAAGWDSAYGLFLRKEAPLVWSYTTSQAYHEAHGDPAGSRRYEAVLFEEGQPIQIEGAALVKNSFAPGEQGKKQKELARQFLEFLISPEVQALVPTHQWMYPARKSTPLPPGFTHVPRPKKTVHLKVKADEVSSALSEWSRAIEGAL